RTDQGRAPKTINGELSVFRQVLKRARLWYRFVDDYATLRNQKPPVGTALTSDEQRRLFEVAQTRPSWLYAYVATTLGFYCRLFFPCEALFTRSATECGPRLRDAAGSQGLRTTAAHLLADTALGPLERIECRRPRQAVAFVSRCSCRIRNEQSGFALLN